MDWQKRTYFKTGFRYFLQQTIEIENRKTMAGYITDVQAPTHMKNARNSP